jgi:hypothetical protein
MAAPPPTKLDANQVLKASFDEANGRLRTDTTITGDIVIGDVTVSQTESSIRIGDGTDLVTTTTVGSDVGLDVNILNDIELEIDAASGDNIAISDGVDTLEINTDGSLNASLTTGSLGSLLQGVIWNYVVATYPDAVTEIYTYKNGGPAGSIEAVIEVTYTDSSKEALDNVFRST